MRINENRGETPEERKERLGYENSGQLLGKIGIIAILIVLGICLAWVGGGQGTFKSGASPIGDPYHCESCKALGRACSKHKNFDRDSEIKEQVEGIVYGLATVDTSDIEETESLLEKISTESKQALYGAEYNKDCDFCNKGGTECYGCEFEREYLLECYDSFITDKEHLEKLCDSCIEHEKPECSLCCNLAIQTIEKSIF